MTCFLEQILNPPCKRVNMRILLASPPSPHESKTKITAKVFEKDLHRCLGDDNFKPKHQHKAQGKFTTVGKVFMRVCIVNLSRYF